MTILFCRIGWMKNYQGQTETDTIEGGGSYVEENGTGFEVCNFARNSEDGCFYGYVRVLNAGAFNLAKLGGGIDNKYVDDVTVVWVATDKDEEAGSSKMKIVGWYRHARVFAKEQFQPIPQLHQKNGIDKYRIKATEATLLPVKDREFFIPHARTETGGFGNNNIWYAQNDNAKEFVDEVIQYIDKYEREKRLEQLNKLG
ncbi:hypothetical protein A4G20_05205 [Pasteurellaceae bacterium RH1A]|nr:hypothetical protein A4G20_05205 [Pasteurellaceae bacterium RH1A]